jgi:eukaryotic-like serine/threonine-protein kinase
LATAKPIKLQNRYELGEILGRGGMGVVYRAMDALMNREVALKTILDVENQATIDLFFKECSILAAMVHPNIVSIYDVGEFEHEGVRRPFFVMPLLPGRSLDRILRDSSARYGLDTLIEIFLQASRGLHAAHEMGLVHRDVKPSNIFVMPDNSVKIIDFGIARAASAHSNTTLKGTLYYMAPEQFQMKAPTPLCDQYSLAVVVYEALARRKPFQGKTEDELVQNVLTTTPPPISDFNANISYAISQVVHKAMAKQPLHRFFSIREFGEALRKALRNEPIEEFDPAKIKPRLERASAALENGESEFASEVLAELENEGYLDQEITLLRRRLDQRVKQQRVKKLLENAVRYFEAEEYPLALRKIQEAIELDPEHPDALALKNRVEKQRREKKIDDWIQLARRHVNNQSFRQAREALDNILKLKPNETEALQLLDEIERREQAYAKVRDKKMSLYQAAMQSWERGDVTAALTKLDDLMSLEREHPDTESGRSNTYQSFYNQVRSEHDELKNSYEEARRQLAAENFAEALAIANQYLNKYPGHALFQALKYDIEQRHRQRLSAFIAETDLRVDGEHDLDQRLAILEQAAAQYPEEGHFASALKLVKDKRDLVNSIVSRAQFFEERGQFNEALDQWQILGTIHQSYPGLAFEIERLTKRRDQEARLSAKARWVEDIDRFLEAGDYDRAQKAVEHARAEFPDDAEIPELDKLVRKSREKAAESAALLAKARELSDADQLEESLPVLRNAYQTDPRNSAARTVLVNTLLDQARRYVDKEYELAEPMLRELLEIQPNHPAAQSLLIQVADRKHEDIVSWCATQARRLQTDGDYEGALVLVQKGLDRYPQEKVLLQLRATLQRAHAVTGPIAAKALAMPASAGASSEPAPQALAGTPPPAKPLAPLLADPSSVPALVSSVDISTTPRPAPSPPPAPAPSPSPGPHKDVRAVPQKPAPPPVPTIGGKIARLRKKARKTWRQMPRPYRITAIASGCAFLGLVAVGIWAAYRKPPPPPPPPLPTARNVSIQASVSRALISIDGKSCGTGSCQESLALGNHHITASLDGYKSASAAITVTAKGAIEPVQLALEALLANLQVSTNLDRATVALDDAAPLTVENGDVEIPDVASGDHVLHFRGEGVKAEIPFTVTPGAMPSIGEPTASSNAIATAAAVLGGSAKIVSTVKSAPVLMDGAPDGSIDAGVLTLDNIARGTHELAVAPDNGGAHRLTFEAGAAPLLATFIGANRNVGSVRITAGVDDADIYVDGHRVRRRTHSGHATLYLAPGKYRIRVSKEGYRPSPEQTVEIKNGEEAKLDLPLTQIPTTASFSLHGAPPGAQILVDGHPAGVAGADGSFHGAGIAPGSHTLTIRKPQYKPRTIEQAFVAGQNTDIDGTLASSMGTLKIVVSPAAVSPTITVQREGEPARALAGRSESLPEGKYTIAGRAAGQADVSVTAQVTAGQTQTVTLAFHPRAKSANGQSGVISLSDIAKMPQWTRGDRYIAREGGGLVMIPGLAGPGTLSFAADVIHGRRLAWVMHYVDERNYVLYELDNNHLERTVYRDGAKTSEKWPVKIKRDHWFEIDVTWEDGAISVAVGQGAEKPLPVDRFIGEDLASGGFGFRIPGHDEIALSDFHFTHK